MIKKDFPIDTSDPMNGLITYLTSNNLLNDSVSINASSTYTPFFPGMTTVDTLLARNIDNYFQFGKNAIGEYFEVHLLKGTFITLTGYGFMATTKNWYKPRNWNVSCMSTNPPTLLGNEVNNDSLCQGYERDYCPTNDKKAFDCTELVNCSDIRFTTTGPASGTSSYHFALAGIELFGYYYSYPTSKISFMKNVIIEYISLTSYLFIIVFS